MSRPPYPHRLPYRNGLIGLCKCGAACSTAALTAPVGDGREAWYEVGTDCPAALREALAETEARAERAEAELSARGTCGDPLTALLDRLAEGAQVAAEEVDAATGCVATFDSEAPALAGLGGEQMQRIRLEVACVRGDSLTPQARLREYRLRAERAEAERDAARKMLAECYRLSGADPDGDGWEHLWQTAVDEVRELRQQHDELRRERRADTDKAVAAALEARAKELNAKAAAALTAADKAEEAGDEEREDAESARWTAYRVAARIVRGV